MPEDRPRPNFNRHPMLWLATAFATGILAAKLSAIHLDLWIAAGGALAITSFLFRGQNLAAILMLAAFAAAGSTLAIIETASIAPDRLRVLYDNGTFLSGDAVEVEGVLSGRPEPSIDGAFLNLRSEKITYRGTEFQVSGNVRLFLPVDDPGPESDSKFSPHKSANVAEAGNREISDLRYGSRVRVACKLKREDEFLNPGVMQKREILDRLDVDVTGTIKSQLLVEKLADESVFLPLASVYDQRAELIDDFKHNLGRSSAGIMIASLLGDKYFLDKETADLVRDGGTFHILVISGLHITFIGGLMLLFLQQLTRNRWTQFIVTMIVLWTYTLAVGADVPVVRAAIMFTIVSFSYVIYRQSSLLNSLGVCGLLLLVWRPSDLFNPSFQLTFVSVAAIVSFAYPLLSMLRSIGDWVPLASTPFPPNVPSWLKRLCEMLYWNPDAWRVESKRQIWTANLFKRPFMRERVVGVVQTFVRYFFEGVLVSVIVQIWMLPLVVVYFHRISVASVLLNLWVGGFIALESFAGVIGALVSHFSIFLAAPFFMFAEVFNWLMLTIPRVASDNGWASFRLPAYSGDGRVIYVLYFLPVLYLALAMNRWKPFALIQRSPITQNAALFSALSALAVSAGIIAFHPFSAPRSDGRLHFDFLDVGQGDSALVRFPDGGTLLVDGGGRVSFGHGDNNDAEPFEPDRRGIGEAVVSEFLWEQGYSRIDHILATHADADHIQGLTDVAKNFGVGSAIFGRTPMKDPDFATLVGVLRRRGIPTELVARGDRFNFGGVTVEVLYPTASDDPDAISDNDHSVVLRFVYGSRAFLLTGDIERQAESALLNNGGNLAADLVKVPHHGSRTSSTPDLIEATQAKYVVFSVGRNSPFGHPHPEVVERWRASGAAVMTTGERGTVSVSTDGKDLIVDQFLP